MAFSFDLRQRVPADCRAGLTYAAIARKYTVSAEWVRTSTSGSAIPVGSLPVATPPSAGRTTPATLVPSG